MFLVVWIESITITMKSGISRFFCSLAPKMICHYLIFLYKSSFIRGNYGGGVTTSVVSLRKDNI
jgi:hypothetical protein